ncbi:response regulator [Opitutus sp. ER46]|uniref:response regulator n=1 Tax=Opitutus sp. ER46 TaxID=2161864 RepID=UPI000D30115F|nr:response regulator [Opitutus sp. ER46]PTY00334.1 hypothetical protein DB354_01610 [Opitutus sp. ER46]
MTHPSQRPDSVAPGVLFAADDDENDRELFRALLAAAGVAYPCRPFARGEEMMDALIEVLRGAPAPVACFLDVKMGGMSGLDVLRWIRAQGPLQSVPVIMLSSCEDPDCLLEALRLGAQCYTAKFPKPEQLRAIIAAAEQHAVAASCADSFPVSCNLMLALGRRQVELPTV